jgi:hypothetical protein
MFVVPENSAAQGKSEHEQSSQMGMPKLNPRQSQGSNGKYIEYDPL